MFKKKSYYLQKFTWRRGFIVLFFLSTWITRNDNYFIIHIRDKKISHQVFSSCAIHISKTFYMAPTTILSALIICIYNFWKRRYSIIDKRLYVVYFFQRKKNAKPWFANAKDTERYNSVIQEKCERWVWEWVLIDFYIKLNFASMNESIGTKYTSYTRKNWHGLSLEKSDYQQFVIW